MTFKSNAVTSFLGVDTGGTFTDFVYFTSNEGQGRIITHKVLSTPAEPERAILQGIEELQIPLQELRLIHGSTVATNAVLEGKGVKTVYITNRGMQDVLTIGRQARKELYNLRPGISPPPVPADLCLQTGGRLDAKGEVIEELGGEALNELVQQVQNCQPTAVAVNLLFSFLDASFEKIIKDTLSDEFFVSCSHEIMPEYREYERGITTWLNAYVGPLVQGYLNRLEAQTQPAHVAVMRSSGQTCQIKQAGREAVNLLLSGPAGGLSAARSVAAAAGESRLLTFDMGGTSTDVAMIDGEIVLSNQSLIAGYPVGVPMVDMHTIGAGGGSIARVDAAQGLHVGPESAGANPGPACYGLGGRLPTVTDANLLLGHLPLQQKLAGGMALQYDKAEEAIATLREPLGISDISTIARGIVAMANEAMSKALRVISVERGIDPREFVLMAFGGAGGMHVCALADSLEMNKAMVPAHSGVLSALGMLVAPAGRVLSRTIVRSLTDCDEDDLKSLLTEMQDQGLMLLEEDGHNRKDIQTRFSLDLCYRGQSTTLNLQWQDFESLVNEFHTTHEQKYGHRLQRDIQIVNLRVILQGPAAIDLPGSGDFLQQAAASAQIHDEGDVPLLHRQSLQYGQQYSGTMLIVDSLSTVYLQRGWCCVRHSGDSLLLSKT